MDMVRITRRGTDMGKNTDRRVYVYHSMGRIYSSTEDPARATLFERDEAERLVDTKWHGLEPRIET